MIWYSQGFVTPPAGPDLRPESYGYDNGGFFGPQFANLGGDPFLVTWTADRCNCYGGAFNPIQDGGPRDGPVFDAVLTINGVSLELNAEHNIALSMWRDLTPQHPSQVLQLQTVGEFRATAPPFQPVIFSNQYTLNTTGYDAEGHGLGGVYLTDSTHQFPTDLALTVTHIGPTAVPLPPLGAGLPSLLAVVVISCWLWQRHAHRHH